MIQTLTNKGYFDLVYNSSKGLLTYVFNGGASCSIWPNESDKLHGENLGLTAKEHKVIHELTHHYIAKALGYNFCPVVYAEAHKLPFPENTQHLEEIIFAMVYFCQEKEMLFDNWYSYLDRLYKRENIFKLKSLILSKFILVKAGVKEIQL